MGTDLEIYIDKLKKEGEEFGILQKQDLAFV